MSLADAASGGRAASIARRLAQSAGKAALPPARERVRDGFRGATLPPGFVPPVPPQGQDAVAAGSPPVSPSRGGAGLTGRALSIERRRLLSAGKAALAAPVALAPAPESVTASAASGREIAVARRAALSQHGRSAVTVAIAVRSGTLDYAPKVIDHATQGGQRVTGMRIDEGFNVTGATPGAAQPVSGTQYIDSDHPNAWRASGPKVGHMRTPAGLVVSGTLVRSKVPVTGDEAGHGTITGRADQSPDDDMTKRSPDSGGASAQFRRQADPHGATVFGPNLARSARSLGSRERSRALALEATESGQVITGSAIGRSGRVTGDETGACRAVTGSQYMAPARRQSECGSGRGGTAPAALLGTDRADPVTVAKVSVAQSWGGQRVTGPDVEHHPSVTGDAPGSCALLTGSQYQGPVTAQGFCPPHVVSATAGRMARRAARAAITGDTPLHQDGVTGIARGADREVSGTPYYRATAEAAPVADPVAAIDGQFSVRSPQRAAHLQGGSSGITGSFAVGGDKITGNLEFLHRPRPPGSAAKAPASTRISGEGSVAGRQITGSAWEGGAGVTGTGGALTVDRNPSRQAGKPHSFAGATQFKAEPRHEEPRLTVTGLSGYVSKTGAKVTLTGGAQS